MAHYICLVKISFKVSNEISDANQFLLDLFADFHGTVGWTNPNFSSFASSVGINGFVINTYLRTLTFIVKVDATEEQLRQFMSKLTAHGQSKIIRLYGEQSQCLTDYGFSTWEDSYITTIN
jgi:hypothetical protein